MKKNVSPTSDTKTYFLYAYLSYLERETFTTKQPKSPWATTCKCDVKLVSTAHVYPQESVSVLNVYLHIHFICCILVAAAIGSPVKQIQIRANSYVYIIFLVIAPDVFKATEIAT